MFCFAQKELEYRRGALIHLQLLTDEQIEFHYTCTLIKSVTEEEQTEVYGG